LGRAHPHRHTADGFFSVIRQASFVGIGAVTGLTDADEEKLAECG
jgi:hypothetical protein